MRVSMTLEAQDKASRAIRATQKSVAGFNKTVAAGADKSVRATARATTAQSRHEQALAGVARAQDIVARGAGRVGDASVASARAAERAWQRAMQSLGVWSRRQGELIAKGGGMIGQGAGRIWEGAKGAGRVASGLATGAGVLGLAGGLLMTQLAGPAGEYEQFATILTTLEGSAAGAQSALAWISDFAAKTPYDLAGVTDAFVKLRAYGLAPMGGLLKTLGDTSAAMGKPLIQSVEAMADAVTGEFERLKEFGIKGAVDGAYAVFAFTAKDGTQKTLKALKNDRKAIEKALAYIWDQKYAGAMDALSATWEGMVSNLGDQWSRLRLMIMNAGLFEWMKGRLGEILGAIDRMTADGTFQSWAKDVSTTLISTLEKGWEVAKGLGAAIATVASGAERVAIAIGGWENFSYLLIAAAFAQPIYYLASGLFLMARGAFVAGLALLRVLAILSVSSSLWAFLAAIRIATAATMLFGRALIFATVAGVRGAVLGIAAMARGLVALPGLLIAAARGVALLVAAGLRTLPAALLGAARGIAAMAAAGLAALPAALMGLARGVTMLSVAGLKALPAMLLAAARALVMFGASLLATPLGWFIAGVAAIAAAAYLIYDNWDSIGPWFAAQWEALKNFDWAGLLPDWSALLPDWDWSAIIPSISLPSFNWSGLLPDWDWSSIIPSLPDFSSWFGGAGEVTSARDMQQLAVQSEQAQKLIVGIGPAAQAAVQAASSALSAASFHSHGVALMQTLAAGIRAGAGAAVGAVQGVTQQMRDYLPHSPAKVGPLSDLDRVRFSETLAGAIRPGPAVAAARSVAAGMRGALSDVAPRSAGLLIGTAAAGGSGGPTVQVSYSPVLTMPAGTPEAQGSAFEQMLRQHADVLANLVDEALRRRQRKEY